MSLILGGDMQNQSFDDDNHGAEMLAILALLGFAAGMFVLGAVAVWVAL